MVKVTNSTDDIISLWKEAFGDSNEDILFFVNNLKNGECLAIYDDDEQIVSMLYFVDCRIDGVESKYIYAACTSKKCRSNGSMTQLLEWCKNNYNNICLIPANDGLIDFYKKRDFQKEIDIASITFDESDAIKEYLFEGCELEKPFALQYKGV